MYCVGDKETFTGGHSVSRASRFSIAAAAIFSLAVATIGIAAPRPAASTHPPKLKRGVTVYVWDQFSDAKHDPSRAALNRVVAGWERLTGDRVDLAGNGGSAAYNLCSTARSGKAPDLVSIAHEQISVLRGCRSLRPVPAWAWSVSAQRSDIPAAALAPRIAGQEWAMPWAITMPVLYYNRSLVPAGFFSKGAVSWTRVVSLAKRLTNRKKKTYGLVWDTTNFSLDYGLISGAGGYVFPTDRKGFNPSRLGLDSRGAISGLTLLRDLSTAGKYKLISPAVSDPVALGLFANGKAAMYLGRSSNTPYFEAFLKQLHRTYRFGTAPLPSVGRSPGHPLADVQVFVANRYSGHPNEAMSLLSYMTTHMEAPEYRAAGWTPVLKSDLAAIRVPIDRGLALEAPYADPVPNIPQMNVVWGPMNQAVAAIVKGKESPAGAAHKAAREIRTAIGLRRG